MRASPVYVAATGQPFDDDLQRALRVAGHVLQRQYVEYQDDCVLADVLESVGEDLVRIRATKGIRNLTVLAINIACRRTAAWRRHARKRGCRDLTVPHTIPVAVPECPPLGMARVPSPEVQAILTEIMNQFTPDEQDLLRKSVLDERVLGRHQDTRLRAGLHRVRTTLGVSVT